MHRKKADKRSSIGSKQDEAGGSRELLAKYVELIVEGFDLQGP